MNTTETDDFEWYDDTIKVNDDGHVQGSAFFGSFEYDGELYDVTISVYSYDYERRGSLKTNHVPQVVITTRDGSIVKEPHAHDSNNPDKAIDEAKSVGRDVVENPSTYIN